MKVKATKTGFIGGKLRDEGEDFTVTEKQFSKKWMKKLSKPKPAAKPVPTTDDLGV